MTNSLIFKKHTINAKWERHKPWGDPVLRSVSKGDVIMIKYLEGTVNLHGNYKDEKLAIFPNGMDVSQPGWLMERKYKAGALVGKIGNDTFQPFTEKPESGKVEFHTAQDSGDLYFTVNDHWAHPGDNVGAFKIEIGLAKKNPLMVMVDAYSYDVAVGIGLDGATYCFDKKTNAWKTLSTLRLLKSISIDKNGQYVWGIGKNENLVRFQMEDLADIEFVSWDVANNYPIQVVAVDKTHIRLLTSRDPNAVAGKPGAHGIADVVITETEDGSEMSKKFLPLPSKSWLQQASYLSLGKKDGSKWAVNMVGFAYRQKDDGSLEIVNHGGKDPKPGLVYISAQDKDHAVGIGGDRKGYYYDESKESKWALIPNSNEKLKDLTLNYISYGIDGSVWAVGSEGKVYRKKDIQSPWTPLSVPVAEEEVAM